MDPFKLFECLCLLSGGFPGWFCNPNNFKLIFVWGRAADEWQQTVSSGGVLELAAKMHHKTQAPVYIPGYIGTDKGQTENGYPGPKVWGEALKAFGVHEDMIMVTSGEGSNTKTEFEDFLVESKPNLEDCVLAITQQPHALRAILGALLSRNESGLQAPIIPCWPRNIDWLSLCHGSQGKGPIPRADWIKQEYESIVRYTEQGDMASLDELSGYLKKLQNPENFIP